MPASDALGNQFRRGKRPFTITTVWPGIGRYGFGGYEDADAGDDAADMGDAGGFGDGGGLGGEGGEA
jgi:hypothetical protein